LEKAVGYDNRRRLIAQIRKAKLQIEPSNNDKDSKNAVTRSSKLEKAVGYDNRRRLIAQIRKAKLQIEPSNNDKDSKNVVTRSSKTVRDGSPAQPHKQNISTTLDNVSFFKTRKTIIKTERSISLRESHSTLNSNLQSYSPQNATTRSLPFEESRSMLPQERN
ncbi:Hypothetical protein CINCED_3A012080, partial [Cinara cedri]